MAQPVGRRQKLSGETKNEGKEVGYEIKAARKIRKHRKCQKKSKNIVTCETS